MDPVSQTFAAHYRQCFAEHGATPRGLDWGPRQEDLDLRYHNMLAVIAAEDRQRPVSVLDVGCGYGGLLTYAQAQGLQLRYTGIDLVTEMLEHARAAHPSAAFLHGDVLDFDPAERFDYVVCNGILTPRYKLSVRAMDAYCRRMLRKMFALAGTGMAVNLMTTKVNFMEDHLYYINPVEMFGFCLTELTAKLRIDHAYRLYEYTLYLYRSGALEG
jgi:SAM-dependent methyltransferase